MLIIIGLGNPSKEYADTFHNMGFMQLDNLSEKLDKKIKKAECQSLTATFSKNGEKIVLAKPLTYMNLSGQAVKSLMAKYSATAQDIIVIYDDFDIDRFLARARREGGAGSHNGIKSIISEIGTQDFKRIRLGIGQGMGEKKDYVLSSIKKPDKEQFDKLFDMVSSAIVDYIADKDFDKLMRAINGQVV